MKIATRDIDNFVRKPSPQAAAILLYGPDEGLIRERMNLLTATVVADTRDPFNVADLPGKLVEEDPARLMDEALSLSMLGGRRVVRVHGLGHDAEKAVKDTLAALRPGGNLVLIAAGELSKNAKLRTLFEGAENAAALPCYIDNERDIGRIIADSLKSAGYSIPSEAAAYMAANVVGDRAVARSEVEKLITYMGPDGKKIALEDVTACIGDSAALPMDDLVRHTASGRFAAAQRVLDHLLSEGVPAVTVLRALQNHFLRLHLTKARLQQGENLDAALKKLKPPPFFKIKDDFEAQLYAWSPAQMEQALALLTAAEAKCKQSAFEPQTLCARAVLALSQMGSKNSGGRRRA